MNTEKIPILDLSPQIEELFKPTMERLEAVIRSGNYINGQEVAAFEKEAAQYLGATGSVGVASGTDAMTLALRALGVGAGDEVITTPFSFFATAESIHQVGALPVFVDIDEKTYNINIEKISAAITSRTRAILPVHLYGRAAPMEAIMTLAKKHNLFVVEDCAQSFGARIHGKRVGTFGDCGAYSFFPSKNLGAMGDGGLVVARDAKVEKEIRALKSHGSHKKYYNETVGYNSRLDEIQAALLRIRLPLLDKWNQGRVRVAQRYNERFASLANSRILTPEIGKEGEHVFHQYTIRIAGLREQVKSALSEQGIQTMIYYPIPIHRLPLYGEQFPEGSFPVSEKAATEVLSLPIWPSMKESVQDRVVEAVAKALK